MTQPTERLLDKIRNLHDVQNLPLQLTNAVLVLREVLGRVCTDLPYLLESAIREFASNKDYTSC